MEFKRRIDYTKYNSNYETANCVDPVLYFTILMTTMCGLMMIGAKEKDAKEYMSYTEMMQVEEQTMSDAELEEWDYFFEVLDRGSSGKTGANAKKLILK